VFQRNSQTSVFAGMGFMSVWLAALIGVLRFGVSEKIFSQANTDLANLAGFVGYPLIGLSFVNEFYGNKWDLRLAGGMLVAWEALTRSFLEKNRNNAKLLTNILFFVGPVASVSYQAHDYETLMVLVAFIIGAVVVTPHHENRIAGVRCVDWFHYILGATAYCFATGLIRLTNNRR
jgi:hypothetical protein